ncbi:MAG: DUF2079 domain-containing protein, partial [Flavobacteriales bacterium]
ILPILAQKFFSGDPAMTGITHHYSIEFVPVLSMALLWALTNMHRYRYLLLIPSLLLSTAGTWYAMEHKLFVHYEDANIKFYEKQHFQSPHADLPFIHQKLSEIPAKASVSASSELTPHLAMRREIYHFPVVRDADYIVAISAHTNYYPLSESSFFQLTGKWQQRGYKVICNEKDLLILQKVR